MLPKLPHRDGISKWRSAEFRGIRHVPGAQTGEIYDCSGVTADDYPVLRTLDWTKRKYDSAAKGVYGSYQYGTAEEDRVYVNAGALFLRDKQILTDKALNTRQQIIGFQRYALLFPAKLWVRTDVEHIYQSIYDPNFPTNPKEGDVIAILSGGIHGDDYYNRMERWYWWEVGEHTGYEWREPYPEEYEEPEDPDAWPIYHEWISVPDGENPRDYMLFSPYAACYLRQGGEWVFLGDLTGSIDRSVTLECTFIDGTYAGETAEGNTIQGPYETDFAEWFSVGDAVTISGSSYAENNKTIIIREIEGSHLGFYEHSFTDNSTAESITISRTVPDLDFLCVNENRVWGCRGQHLYASKLGDFRNWNVFDGLASDSYAVDALSEGDFTGCVSFMGYPVFFKRNAIYKVYGNRPSNFEVMGSASTGCVCGDTLAVASETLFYLSALGVMAYRGGVPSLISEDLGDFITGGETAFGVSDGRKYYFGYPVTGASPVTPVFEYDPEKGMWHKQVYAGTVAYGYRGHKGAVFVTAAGARYGEITAAGSMSDAFVVELAEMDFGSFASKYPVRLWLRLASANAVTVTVSYNGGAFETAFTLPASGKSARNAPVPIRRCDRFAVKLSGTGSMTLYALELELRAQQTNRKGG